MPEPAARRARELAHTWLAELPRDPRGLPIPWINRWGAETAAAARVSWDRHIERPAVFHDDHGDTVDFTRQNYGREREAMVTGLCQVCGRFTPWSRRNLVLSAHTVEQVDLGGGRIVPAVNEPWLDDRCAFIATTLCPALIRRAHDEDLNVVPVRSPREVELIVSVGALDFDALADKQAAHPDHLARLRAAAQRGPLGMWVKAVLLNHQIQFRTDLQQQKAPAGSAGAPRLRPAVKRLAAH